MIRPESSLLFFFMVRKHPSKRTPSTARGIIDVDRYSREDLIQGTILESPSMPSSANDYILITWDLVFHLWD